MISCMFITMFLKTTILQVSLISNTASVGDKAEPIGKPKIWWKYLLLKVKQVEFRKGIHFNPIDKCEVVIGGPRGYN